VSDKICVMMSEGYICAVGIIVKHYISSSIYHFQIFCHVFALSSNMYGLKEKRGGDWRGVEEDCGRAVRCSRKSSVCRSIGARAPR
jgi:hypothetical protein